jgi:hypothetical protein
MLRTQWQAYIDQQDDQPKTRNGVCYLPELGIVEFSGSDTLDFLQGYLTCDTLTLARDTATPMAICNLKGRVVVNGWCFQSNTDTGVPCISLIVHGSLIERLCGFFKSYLLFSKTELKIMGDSTLVFAGPANAGLRGLDVAGEQTLLLIDDLNRACALWEANPHGAANSWQLGLIDAGFPIVSDALSEAFLPQMLNLDQLGAVTFDKGCYLGQEVVARAQHRGEVKRRLQRLDWQGSHSPQPGALLSVAGDPPRNVGTVVNSVTTGQRAGTCLAVLAIEAEGPFRYEDVVLDRSS